MATSVLGRNWMALLFRYRKRGIKITWLADSTMSDDRMAMLVCQTEADKMMLALGTCSDDRTGLPPVEHRRNEIRTQERGRNWHVGSSAITVVVTVDENTLFGVDMR